MTTDTTQDNKPRRPAGRPRVNADPERLYTELPGELLAQLRAHTAARGQSLSAFVRLAILEKLQREGAQ